MNAFLLIFAVLLSVFVSDVVGQQPAAAQDHIIDRDDKIAIGRGFGNITIAGWDRDTLQVTAKRTSDAAAVPVRISKSSGTITVEPGTLAGRDGRINLELKVPDSATLEPIHTGSDSIILTDLRTPVSLRTETGNIKASRTGRVQVRTGNGNITLEQIEGRVDLITGNGNVNVHEANGDVRITSVNAKINLDCIKGRVEISDTSSQIWLTGADGDVDVTTSNGKAYFVGTIRPDGRYRLKTLSGVVSMAISGVTGFSVTLSSYSGKIEEDFGFQRDPGSRSGKTEQRLIGKHGDGKAQIEMDSFDGRVGFKKIAAAAIPPCGLNSSQFTSRPLMQEFL